MNDSGGPITSVYRARPVNCPGDWPADYAIKLIEPWRSPNATAIALLQREAFVARQMSHPNLAPVLAAHVDAPPFYFVMPLLDGVTLEDHLAAGPIDAAQALWIARQAAEALAALHQAGWRHGDVKPANLLVAPTGHVTLIDLGFARRLDESPRGSELLLGTPAYAAPECLCLPHGIGERADVYSLGVTLFEMLAGRRPFSGAEPAELAAAHAQGALPDLRRFAPAAPRDVSQLVRRMLAKEPLRRPSTDELLEQLIRLEIESFAVRPFAA
jgi:serine/threonine-protein kinase